MKFSIKILPDMNEEEILQTTTITNEQLANEPDYQVDGSSNDFLSLITGVFNNRNNHQRTSTVINRGQEPTNMSYMLSKSNLNLKPSLIFIIFSFVFILYNIL